MVIWGFLKMEEKLFIILDLVSVERSRVPILS